MFVTAILQIIVHEGGHLVAGLLTGYRFVSFRVFSLTLIKKDNRFQFRRFSIGGTGGQCLMAPPERPLEQIDTRWYNLGGVLANVLLSTAALLALVHFDLPMWAETFLIMLMITGYIFALLNGLPLKISGVGNDGHNLLHLEKSPVDKRILCQILQANANIQEGQQPKDLPSAFFEGLEEVDWSDSIQTNWLTMVVGRMENLHQWDEAYQLLTNALDNKKEMPQLIVMEITCEMVFVSLVKGLLDEAKQLYTQEVQKYVKTYARIQSSKQRLAFAVALIMKGDKEEASRILSTLKSNRHQYLLQGEIDMDIELMEWLMQHS